MGNRLLKTLKGIAVAAILFSLSAQDIKAQTIMELMQEEKINFKEIQEKADAYFAKVGTGKGSGYKLYKRWEYWASRKLDDNGYVITDSEVYEEQVQFARAHPKPLKKGSQKAGSTSNWIELGPRSWSRTSSWAPGLGRIVSIAVEPTSQQLLFAGSPGGGIWRSKDAGLSWEPLGDQLLNMSIWAIAIDPLNTDIIYHGNSSSKLLKSTNQGDSWVEVGSGISGTPKDILIHPTQTNRIWVATSSGIYYSSNSGTSFSRISNTRAEDLDFKPGDLNTMYACGTVFQKSTDGGASFTTISTGIVSTERMKMAVTPANSAIIYLVQKSGSAFGRLYKSTNSGASFSVVVDNTTITDNQIYFTQANRDMAITVSSSDANEVHLGGIDYSRSLNGGVSWTKMASWSAPTDPSYIHADVEVMMYVNGTMYTGTDGGISRSTNRGDNMTDLTQNGLAVRQYYRFGNSTTDEDMLVGGAQDNGTNIMKNKSDDFIEWLGADGMECFIDFTNANVIYGTSQNGTLYKSTNGGNSRFGIDEPTQDNGNWVTPFEMDPINNNWIYAGYTDLYRHENGGENGAWVNVSTGVDFGGNLDEFKISKSNHDVIYAANNSNMWVTKNATAGTPTWTSIGTGFTGNVNYISIDPDNEDNVVIGAGTRVYKSTNSGSTWTQLSSGIPSISVGCVLWDDGNQNGIYAGLDKGVYYINDTMASWEFYGDDLPNVEVTELEIHYGSRKLRVATYGRGMWECDLYGEGIRATIASATSSGCNGDVIALSSTITAPGSFTYQWYRDGGIISGATNSTYNATQSGEYSLSIQQGTEFGQSNTVSLSITASVSPITEDVSSCGGGTFVLTATANEVNGELTWYSDAGKNNVVGQGTTLSPTLTSSTTYYIDEKVDMKYFVGIVDNTVGGGGFYTGTNSLIFDAITSFKLKEVTVYANGAGARTLTLTDGGGTEIHSESFTMVDGENRLTLDLTIAAGTAYEISFGSGSDLFRTNSGTNYPYTVDGLISITSSTAGDEYYYYFYNWEVEKLTGSETCVSPLAELNVEIIENDAPVTVGGIVCKSGDQVDLKATGISGGDLVWYDVQSGGMALDTGDVITVSVLNTKSYYVEEVKGIERYNLEPLDNSLGGGGSHGGGQYLLIDALKPFVIEDVTVYATGTKDRTLELLDANDNVIETRTINIADGEQVLNLSLDIPEGTGMQLGFATGADLFRNNSGTNYPYSIPDVVTVSGSSAGEDYYYYLYNMKIVDASNACISPRAEAEAELTICTGTVDAFAAEVGVYPNPSSGMVFFNLEQGAVANSIQVINSKGERVFEKKNVNGNVNLKGLAKGVYFIIIETDDQRLSKKIVLE